MVRRKKSRTHPHRLRAFAEDHGVKREPAIRPWDSARLAPRDNRSGTGTAQPLPNAPTLPAAPPPKVRRVAVNEIGYRIGTSHPNCKLSDAAIELILELRDAGLSYRKIAAKFDDPDEPSVSPSMVFKVCQGLVRAQVIARIKTTVIEPVEVDIAGWFEIGAGEDVAAWFEVGAGEEAPLRRSWPAQAPARHSWGRSEF